MRHQRKHRRPQLFFDIAHLGNARPAPLPDRLEPQIASLATSVPAGGLWLHETRFEGFRLIARVALDGVRVFDREQRDWRLPAVERALAGLPVENALLDGQLVALQPDGTSDFRRLQKSIAARRTAPLVYESFDLLHLDGYDLSEVDLASRKRALKAILTGDGALANRGAVRYVHHFEGNGTELFAEVCRLGLAGVVCKLRTSRYRGGESTEWLEVRCLDRPAAAHHEKRLRLASLGTLRSARERARDSSEH